MASLRRLRRRLASEGGSLLVEVLVSASILLTVGAGVVMVLMTSDAQSSLQRSKALATDVAQTKLDALRAIGYNDLRPLSETATVNEGGVDFTVVSTATPVAQTDAPTGCLTSRARDYLSLKATVTWAEMGTRKPVVLQTMVAAPIGAGGGLVVSVTGALGQAVPNIPIALSSGGGSATTDATGCARWDAVVRRLGLLAQRLGPRLRPAQRPAGREHHGPEHRRGGDRAEELRLRPRRLRPPAVPAEDGRRCRSDTPVDADALPADVVLAASNSITKPVTPVSGAVGSAGLFYPYPSTAYSVYADNCTAAKPRRPARRSRRRSSPQAGPCRPRRRRCRCSSRTSTSASLNGNTGTTKIWVKTACGTIIGPRAIVADGTMKNPGLPYGTGFTVCAVDGSKKVSRTVDNTSYSAAERDDHEHPHGPARQRRHLPLPDAMSRLRNDQGGFTLIELLVSMAVGMIVMAGILGLLDMTLRGSASSLGRTQAVREGRGAIDRVGQELRLASCPDTGSAIISADADTVSYYVSRPLADYAAAPVVERHTLTYSAANGTISLSVSPGTGTPPTWSATPSRTDRHRHRPVAHRHDPDLPVPELRRPGRLGDLADHGARRGGQPHDDRAGPRHLHGPGRLPERRSRQLALPERHRAAHRRPLRRGQHARMLILRNLLRRLRREDGFTMMLVVGTMAVVVVAVGLVLSDVQGDFKPGRKDEDRKVAYAAAEAGIADYQARLESNPSYWAQCVDANNPSLGQVGTKNFVSMPGSSAQYAIELLPTNGFTSCSTSNAASMVSGAGEFRIRVTGRPRAGDTTQRQIIATFRPKGFLNYIYYTDYETLDPKLYSFVTKGGDDDVDHPGRLPDLGDEQLRHDALARAREPLLDGQVRHHDHDRRLLGDPVRPERQGLRPVPHERPDHGLRAAVLRPQPRRRRRGRGRHARLAQRRRLLLVDHAPEGQLPARLHRRDQLRGRHLAAGLAARLPAVERLAARRRDGQLPLQGPDDDRAQRREHDRHRQARGRHRPDEPVDVDPRGRRVRQRRRVGRLLRGPAAPRPVQRLGERHRERATPPAATCSSPAPTARTSRSPPATTSSSPGT